MKALNLFLTWAVISLALTACSSGEDAGTEAPPEAASPAADMMDKAAEAASGAVDSAKLAAVLAAQSDDMKARYPARHPQQTLEFFGIAPGMTVVTASWSRIHRIAICAVVMPAGVSFVTAAEAWTPRSNGSPAKVSPTLNIWPSRL